MAAGRDGSAVGRLTALKRRLIAFYKNCWCPARTGATRLRAKNADPRPWDHLQHVACHQGPLELNVGSAVISTGTRSVTAIDRGWMKPEHLSPGAGGPGVQIA